MSSDKCTTSHFELHEVLPIVECVLDLFGHEVVGHIDVTQAQHDHQQRARPHTDVTKDILELEGAGLGVVEVQESVRHRLGVGLAVQFLIILH